jgi:hypothetical protein
LLRHAQRLLARLLDGHEAVTKAECARRITSTDPMSRRASSPRGNMDKARS